jgi:tryptophanyl-tRNA synthetase
MKKRVLSGIRATGRLHLGNYLGAVLGMVELQESGAYEAYYMVADLHTLTTPFEPGELQKQIREVVLDYLAAGIDPSKSTLFIQSQVPAHLDLAFLFSTTETVARMQHLPTFKEKVKEHPQDVTMALLNYPILMAADILAYKADLVPVGIDQEPHLEVAREVARKMNEKYNTRFPEPQRFATKGEYIPSLTGEGKMSKSVEGSFILLTDSLETVKERLAKVPTDSGKGEEVPTKGGVAVLMSLVEIFEGADKKKAYEKKYLGEGLRYSELKEELSKAIFKVIKPIQDKRRELEKNPAFVNKVLTEGSAKANELTQATLQEVKEGMGLL